MINEEKTSLSSSSRRKALKPIKRVSHRSNSIDVLRVDDMRLSVEGAPTAYFKRLKYKGCPPLARGANAGALDPKHQYINMNRDKFVRTMYRLFEPVSNVTWLKGHMYELIKYVRWLDENSIDLVEEDYFPINVLNEYLDCLEEQVQSGAKKLERRALEMH